MSENMNEAVFDFVLEHALGDNLTDELSSLGKSTAAVSISEQFRRFFKKLIARRKRHAFAAALPRRAKRAAVFVAVGIAVLSGLLLTQEPVLAAVKSVFYSWGEDFLEFRIHEDPDAQEQNPGYYGIRLDYLPEGYTMAEASVQPLTFSINKYLYLDAATEEELWQKEITIQYSYANNSIGGGVDNEHGVLTPLEIEGATEVQYLQCTVPGYFSYVLWVKDGFFFNMYLPYEFSKEEAKRIAEGIQIIQ